MGSTRHKWGLGRDWGYVGRLLEDRGPSRTVGLAWVGDGKLLKAETPALQSRTQGLMEG